MRRCGLLVVALCLVCNCGDTRGRNASQAELLLLAFNRNLFLFACPVSETLASGSHVKTFVNGAYWFTYNATSSGADQTITIQEAAGQDTRLYARTCNSGESDESENAGVGQLETIVFATYSGRPMALRLECASACTSSFTISIP